MSETPARAADPARVRHLLDIGSLRRETLDRIFELADSLGEVAGQSVKKVPLLRGKTIVLLFFEASTRTRTTFEIAAKRLSADVVTINTQASATRKGESLLDTVRTLRPCRATCSWCDTRTAARRTWSPVTWRRT